MPSPMCRWNPPVIDRRAAEAVFAASEVVHSQATVEAAVAGCARAICAVLAERDPVVVCVMNGGLPYTAALLTHMRFPLQLEHVYAT